MTNWSISESCRRDQILHYFQEDRKVLKPEHCCDICGFDVSIFDQLKVEENVHVEFSWKQRLADILLS